MKERGVAMIPTEDIISTEAIVISEYFSFDIIWRNTDKINFESPYNLT